MYELGKKFLCNETQVKKEIQRIFDKSVKLLQGMFVLRDQADSLMSDHYAKMAGFG